MRSDNRPLLKTTEPVKPRNENKGYHWIRQRNKRQNSIENTFLTKFNWVSSNNFNGKKATGQDSKFRLFTGNSTSL